MTETNQPELHTRYPIMSILTYNGATIVHYFLGSWGILIGYNFTTAAINISAVYFLFSFIQMYVLMPLMVGPTCVYYRTDGALCISALNLVSKKFVKQGQAKNFGNRARGLL